jgi:hypothetical protein
LNLRGICFHGGFHHHYGSGFSFDLFENVKEGWTKGTTYKVSEGAFGEGGWAVQGRKVERLRVIGIFL